VITKRHSVAKSVGCFQRRLFVCLSVNTITSKHSMIFGGRCTVQKFRPSSNFGVIDPGCAPPKCGVGLRCSEKSAQTVYCSYV